MKKQLSAPIFISCFALAVQTASVHLSAYAQSGRQSITVARTSSESPADGTSPHRAGVQAARPLIRLKADAAPWERYLQAGEQFNAKGDQARAKQYYFEALRLLENNPKAAKLGHLGRMEGDIMRLYPNYPREKARGEGPAQIKQDEEEIAVLSRLTRLNQVLPNRGLDLIAQLVQTQVKLAQKDLEKNKTAEHEKADVAAK
jgi:hypothetical protein